MGAPPPGSMYATLYFGIAELTNIPRFTNHLLFYQCYLDDDCFGAWLMPANPAIKSNENEWLAFQHSMSYGKLNWIFTNLCTSVNFLDLTISISDNPIITKIYEKPLNLYLYLPPHSTHPRGLVHGMILGGIGRIYWLASEHSDPCKQPSYVPSTNVFESVTIVRWIELPASPLAHANCALASNLGRPILRVGTAWQSIQIYSILFILSSQYPSPTF